MHYSNAKEENEYDRGGNVYIVIFTSYREHTVWVLLSNRGVYNTIRYHL